MKRETLQRWMNWMVVVGSAIALNACGAAELDEEPNELPAGKYEAWNSANNPAFVDNSFVYDVASLPVAGETKTPPTPGDYWATARDSINVRWDGEQSQSPAEKIEAALGKTGFAKAVTDNFGIYSGNRKACNESSECDDQKDGSSCVKPRSATGNKAGRCIPGWWGICHGWSPFAISEPAPVNPVVRNGVTFYPGDLEGILSLVYSRNLPTKFLSSRCDKEDPTVDNNGRITNADSECRDMNAGSFHVVASNFLGLRKVGYVEDRTYDLQVWNQPVRSFAVTNAVDGKLKEVTKTEAVSILGLNLSYSDLVSNVDVAKDGKKDGSYTATVAGDLIVKMTGSGDADLYVRTGAAPTADTYDCRPYTGSTNEECKLTVKAGDQVFWQVNGYAATSKFTIAVGKSDGQPNYVYNTTAARFFYVETDLRYISESEPARTSHVPTVDRYTRTDHYQYILEADAAGKIIGGEWVGDSKSSHPDFAWWPNGKPYGTLPGGLTYPEAKSLLDEAAGTTTGGNVETQTLMENVAISGSSKYFPVGVPGGATLKVESSGSGDVDLYVRLGVRPSVTSFDAKSENADTSKEGLSVKAPAAGGTYYVRVKPNKSSTVTVTATITK